MRNLEHLIHTVMSFCQNRVQNRSKFVIDERMQESMEKGRSRTAYTRRSLTKKQKFGDNTKRFLKDSFLNGGGTGSASGFNHLNSNGNNY